MRIEPYKANAKFREKVFIQSLETTPFNQWFSYFLRRGSMASVSPSPIKLKMVTVIKMAKPGKIANHHALGDCLADESKAPHVTSSPLPKPKKDKEDSIKMAEAIPKAIAINTGARALGIACFTMVLQLE